MVGHEQVECTEVENTSIKYDAISHLYECPTCKKQHRYAEPKEGEYVFCIGTDFGLFIPQEETYIAPIDEFLDYEEVTE